MRHFPVRFESYLHVLSNNKQFTCEQCFELFSSWGTIAQRTVPSMQLLHNTDPMCSTVLFRARWSRSFEWIAHISIEMYSTGSADCRYLAKYDQALPFTFAREYLVHVCSTHTETLVWTFEPNLERIDWRLRELDNRRRAGTENPGNIWPSTYRRPSQHSDHIPLWDDMGIIFFSVPPPCAVRSHDIINLFANYSCSINNIGSRCRVHERGTARQKKEGKKHIYAEYVLQPNRQMN